MAWASLVGIVANHLTLPRDEAVVGLVSYIDFIALSVPCLAFAGLGVSQREVAIAKTSGVEAARRRVLVLVGTLIGSALVADLTVPLLDRGTCTRHSVGRCRATVW